MKKVAKRIDKFVGPIMWFSKLSVGRRAQRDGDCGGCIIFTRAHV